MSYFRTHYYGGVRKYQWATIPLAIHGVFTRADGSSVNFAIGEDENDPVFSSSPLMPSLSLRSFCSAPRWGSRSVMQNTVS